MAAAAQMKAKGDFTNLRDDAASIAAVRAAGMPADKVLSVDTIEQADAAARWVWVVWVFCAVPGCACKFQFQTLWYLWVHILVAVCGLRQKDSKTLICCTAPSHASDRSVVLLFSSNTSSDLPCCCLLSLLLLLLLCPAVL
jgi:cell division FtsZ-interacting protein ZapD